MLEKNKALPGCQVEWKGRVNDGLTLCQITPGPWSWGAISHHPNQPLQTRSQPGSCPEATGLGVMHPGDEAGVLWAAAPGLPCVLHGEPYICSWGPRISQKEVVGEAGQFPKVGV